MVESSAMNRLTSQKLMRMVEAVMRNKKLTSKDVAERMGMPLSTFSYRLRNDRFSLADFLKLCDVLGIDLLWRDTGVCDWTSTVGISKSHRPDLRG